MRKVETFEDEIMTPEGSQTGVIFMKTEVDAVDTQTPEVTYHSQTTVQSPIGDMPVQFVIAANSIEEAFGKLFPHMQVAHAQATKQINEQMEKMKLQQEQQQTGSRIVGPDGSLIGTQNHTGPGDVIAFPPQGGRN